MMEGVSNRTGSPPWGSAAVEPTVTVTVIGRGTHLASTRSPRRSPPPITHFAVPLHVAMSGSTPSRGWSGDTAAGRG